ncbi:MAG TPA: alpha/beta hydrolase [Pseudomonadales bacterium]|nr:alpha/beta hydrolase [Pseudomonadales bacterium]HMZ70698.1 alpha/beta hydrolase [Pseudomonadales bacterium]HMZ92277.1 alpha/beta hydrolase [Pseudomonadales bacterium]HNB83177.1 alpha/beta hydrolase [Pseudomonadales bacterium]HND26342.1 alpha/beta hydrolase [Pseudomonadales bacterium]
MGKRTVFSIVILLLAVAADARPRDGLDDPQTPPDRHGKSAARTIAYGRDALQRLDVWTVPGSDAAPLVMFVHGGGWQRGSKDNASSRWLPAHLTQQGYAYASIDYRLVPAVAVEQQAEDVAHALRALLDRAAELGIDRRRVVLIGHSAGAHLVALVGTDERHLKSAGLGFADLRGVIANDGAAYDVPAQLQEDAPMMHQTYLEVFGSDPARQWALSPTHQAAAPNAPAFLLLHVQRPDAVRQTEALGRALAAAGSAVDYGSFAGTGLRGHMEINRRLGDPDYPATALVDGWLRKNLAE